jgi:hypothetical protein
MSQITTTSQIAILNGNFTVPKRGTQNVQNAQTNPGGGSPGFFLAPTTAGGTQITVPSLCQGGWAYLKNCDPTNFVQWGSWQSGAISNPAPGVLMPGDEIIFRLGPAATLAVLADTAAVPMIIELYYK